MTISYGEIDNSIDIKSDLSNIGGFGTTARKILTPKIFEGDINNDKDRLKELQDNLIKALNNDSRFSKAGWKVEIDSLDEGILDSGKTFDFEANYEGDKTNIFNLAKSVLGESGLKNQYKISITPFISQEKNESKKLYENLIALGQSDESIASSVRNQALIDSQAQYAFDNQINKGETSLAEFKKIFSDEVYSAQNKGFFGNIGAGLEDFARTTAQQTGDTIDIGVDLASYPGRKISGLLLGQETPLFQDGPRLGEGFESFFGETEQEQYLDDIKTDAINLGIQEGDSNVRLGANVVGNIATLFTPGAIGKGAGYLGTAVKGSNFGLRSGQVASNIATKGVGGTYFLSGLSPVTSKLNDGDSSELEGQDFINAGINIAPFGGSYLMRRANINNPGSFNQFVLGARNAFETKPFQANLTEGLLLEGLRTATTDATFEDFALEMGVTAALSRFANKGLRTDQENAIVRKIDNIIATETGSQVKKKIIEQVGDEVIGGKKLKTVFSDIEKGDYKDITSGLTDIWFRYNSKVDMNGETSQSIVNHVLKTQDFKILNDSEFINKVTDKSTSIVKAADAAKYLEDRAKQLNVSKLTTSLKGEVEALQGEISKFTAALNTKGIDKETKSYLKNRVNSLQGEISSINETIKTKDEDAIVETIVNNGIIVDAEKVLKGLDKDIKTIKDSIPFEKGKLKGSEKNVKSKIKNVLLKSGFTSKESNALLKKQKKSESLSDFLERTQDIMRKNLVDKSFKRMSQLQRQITGFSIKTDKLSKKRVKEIERKSAMNKTISPLANVAIINYQKAVKDYGNAISTVFKDVFIDKNGNKISGVPTRVKKQFGRITIKNLPKEKQEAYFYGNNEISKKYYDELKSKNNNRPDISKRDVYKTENGELIRTTFSTVSGGVNVDARMPATNIVKSGDNYFVKKGKKILAIDDNGNEVQVGERIRVKNFYIEKEVALGKEGDFQNNSIKEKTVYEIDGKEVKRIRVKKTAEEYYEGLMPAYQNLIAKDKKLEAVNQTIEAIDNAAFEKKENRKEKVLSQIKDAKVTEKYSDHKAISDEKTEVKKFQRAASGFILGFTPTGLVFKRGGEVMSKIIPSLSRGNFNLQRANKQVLGIKTLLEKGSKDTGIDMQSIIYYHMYKNNNNLLTRSGKKKYNFFNEDIKDSEGNNTFANNFFINKRTGDFYFPDKSEVAKIAVQNTSDYRPGVEADLLRIEDRISDNKDLRSFIKLMDEHISDRSQKFIETALVYDDDVVVDSDAYSPISFKTDSIRKDDLGTVPGFSAENMSIDKSVLKTKTNNSIKNAFFDPVPSKFFGKIMDTDAYIHMREGLFDVKTIYDSGKLNEGQKAMVRDLINHVTSPQGGPAAVSWFLRKISGAIYTTKLGFRLVQMPVQKIILLTGKLGNKKGFLLGQDYRIYNGRTVREAEIKSRVMRSFFGALDWTGWMRKVRGVQERRKGGEGFADTVRGLQSDVVEARNEGIYGSDRIGHETGMEKFNRIAFLPIKISDSKTTQSFYIGALHKNIEDLSNEAGIKMTEKEMGELAMFNKIPERATELQGNILNDGLEAAMIEAETITATLMQHSDAIFTPANLRGILGATNNFVLQKTASGELSFSLLSSYDRGQEIDNITRKWFKGVADQYFSKSMAKEMVEYMGTFSGTAIGAASVVKGMGFYIIASAMFIQFMKDLFKDVLSDGISEDVGGIMNSFFLLDLVFDEDDSRYGLPYLYTKHMLMGLTMALGIELDEEDAKELKKIVDEKTDELVKDGKIKGAASFFGGEIKKVGIDYIARGSMGLVDYREKYNSGGLFSGLAKVLQGDALGATTDILNTVVALGPITQVLKQVEGRKREFIKEKEDKGYIGTMKEFMQEKQENKLITDTKAEIVFNVKEKIKTLDTNTTAQNFISQLSAYTPEIQNVLKEKEFAKAVYDGVLESGLPINESGNVDEFGFEVLDILAGLAGRKDNTVLLDIDRQNTGLKNNFSVNKYIELLEKDSLNIIEAQERLRNDFDMGRITRLRALVVDKELAKRQKKGKIVFTQEEIRKKLRNSDGTTNNGKIAGFNWAKRNNVASTKRCRQKSNSFSQGCVLYVQSIGGK